MSNSDIPNLSNYFKEENFHSLSAIIEHFEKHPSVTNIKNKNLESTFSFKKTTPEDVVKVIRNSNIKKRYSNKSYQIEFGYFSKVYIETLQLLYW